MVTKRPSEEDIALHASNFGGLNTTASPFNVPSTDATRLLNVDVSLDGKLRKRKGTRAFSDISAPNSDVYSFTSNTGIELTLVRFNKGFSLIQFDNNEILSVYTESNAFKFDNTKTTFMTVPEEHIRVVMFNERETPKQIQLYETTVYVDSNTSSLTFPTPFYLINSTVAGKAVVFKNGVYDTNLTVTHGATTSSISGTHVAGDRIVVMVVTWQWWAEALSYKVDNFRVTAPRFGANEADKLVTVPSTLTDDLEDVGDPYGIFLYSKFTSNLGANTYTLTQPPTKAGEYQWSNGTYSLDPAFAFDTTTTNYATKFFVSFGKESNTLEYNNVELIDFSNSNRRVRIPGHKFVSGDLVTIEQENVNGSTVSTDRYVKVINSEVIELYSDSGLNTLSGITLSNSSEVVLSSDVDAVNDRFNNITNAGDFDSPLKVKPNVGTAMPSGVIFDRTYYGVGNTAFDHVTLYLDPQHSFRENISAQPPNSILIYTTRPIIFRKKVFNSVTFNRARKIPFNGNTGIASGKFDVILSNFFGLFRNDNLSSTGYVLLTDRDNLSTRITDNTTKGQFIALINQANEDSELMLANAENSWSGTSAIEFRFQLSIANSHEGGYYPIYGFSDYADFDAGVFPTVGTFYQERIYLSGFTNKTATVVASGTSNHYIKREYYNYFQITDALSGQVFEPFDFVLDDPGAVMNMTVWQEQLFIFTRNYVYRNGQQLLQPTSRAFSVVSNSGVYVLDSVAIADNDLLFLSYNGVYSLPLIESNEYRSSEISVKIRNAFESGRFNGIHFHKQRKKLFVYSSDTMFVFDFLTGAWTEYYAYIPFNVRSFTDYYDHTLGWFPLSANTNVRLFDGDNILQNCLLKYFEPSYLDYITNWDYTTDYTIKRDAIPFETIVTNDKQYTYKIRTWMPQTEEAPIEVWQGSSIAVASKITTWRKIAHDTIELSSPINSNLYIVPDLPGTWHGINYEVNGVFPVWLNKSNFGTLDLSDSGDYTIDLGELCLTEYKGDVLQQSEDSCIVILRVFSAAVGNAYPSEVAVPMFTQELVAQYKRVEEVYVWFEQSTDRFNFNDIAYQTGDPPFDNSIEDHYVRPTQVNIAVLQNNSVRAAMSEVVAASNTYNEGDMILYREHLQRLGYSYKLYLWSLFFFNLIGYQVWAKRMSGSGFISGGE